jgi:hypothetical protein
MTPISALAQSRLRRLKAIVLLRCAAHATEAVLADIDTLPHPPKGSISLLQSVVNEMRELAGGFEDGMKETLELDP